MRTRRQCAGFTLIETLVAFVIAATVLGLLFRIQANATATAILAEEYLHGTELAQTLEAELPITESTLAFAKSGVAEDRYRWTVRSEPYAPRPSESIEGTDSSRVLLRTVTTTVEWRSRDKTRRLDLRTVKPFFKRTEP